MSFVPVKKGRIRFNALIIGLLMFSMLGTTFLLMSISLQSQTRTLTRSTLQANFEGARNLNVTMNGWMDLMLRHLGSTSRFMIEQGGGDPMRLADGVKPLLGGSRFFNRFFIADEHGLLLGTPPEGREFEPPPVTPEILEAALLERKPYVSKPFIAPGGHAAMLIAHPVMDQSGHYFGLIGGLIDFQAQNVFSDMFNHAVKSQKGSFAYLVDQNGELLMNPDGSRGRVIIEPSVLQRELIRDKARYASIDNPDGEQHLVGYLEMPQFKLGVVFQSPASVVNDAMSALLRAQLAWIIPLFALLLALSLWIARKLTSPFSALTSAARKISANERLDQPPFAEHWNYEAHYLAKAMMRAVRNLQQQADQLSEQARTDALTGLHNRASLEEQLAEWAIQETPYALLVLDIDHFKSVNDTYGHQIGDEAIVHLARVLSSETGGDGVCCRFGGEEFVVLLPHQSLQSARQLAERVRRTMEAAPSPTGSPITVSIGVAVCPDHGGGFERVFDQADQALYQAKRGGRNRTVTAGERPRQAI
ncbi:sensor domain-containing diguanylate cyclase [Paenibacillus methanolicus]|uniref:Diguanylate cyclase (GGDEF)-like protein n=1 Tax=Paenibacillus methanolicus TaxID=582686 RepID=A0A5S5BQU0_9BACL|nr:sensor domain-containing diguanylate cyclase [Paenibacillus methanolicus]TYP69367.1 diguanylate cyclase (GGDEF)-like protein [Paenibacillus methanolicus]